MKIEYSINARRIFYCRRKNFIAGRGCGICILQVFWKVNTGRIYMVKKKLNSKNFVRNLLIIESLRNTSCINPKNSKKILDEVKKKWAELFPEIPYEDEKKRRLPLQYYAIYRIWTAPACTIFARTSKNKKATTTPPAKILFSRWKNLQL